MYSLFLFFIFIPEISIIIESFVGKESYNHYNTITMTENIFDSNHYCHILNSFVSSLGMVLQFFPTKLSGADRKISTIEEITIQ